MWIVTLFNANETTLVHDPTYIFSNFPIASLPIDDEEQLYFDTRVFLSPSPEQSTISSKLRFIDIMIVEYFFLLRTVE
jgi:hypothetical protein